MSPELQLSMQGVRTQYRAMFKRMAYEGHAWHLHSVPGTDRYCLLRDDAVMDVPLPIAVPNVHALTEQRVVDMAVQHFARPARRRRRSDWAEAERISNVEDVDEALREFVDDATADGAVILVQRVIAAYLKG